MAETTSAAAAPPLTFTSVRVQSSLLSNKPALWGSFALGVAIVSVIAFLYVCIKTKLCLDCRHRGKPQGKLDAEEMMLRRFRLEELEKATDNFSEDYLVGSGAFGNVYVGTFGVETFAIKKAHTESYTSSEEFQNEVRLLSRVKHRNLVGLIGFCEEPGRKGQKLLVYEYVPNGSLLEYIIGRGVKILSWRERVNIAIGAAKGIAHLHGVKPSIIHRDIKPGNILVGEGFEAKVADFGLVKSGPVGDKSHVSSFVKGTPGYLDPAYCKTSHLTLFSDVYSFGVILLQLVSARPAVETTRSRANYHIIDWARPSLERGSVDDIIDVNLLLEPSEPCNMEMMLKMGQLGLRCVVKVPKQRPTMTQVWKDLEAALSAADNLIHRQPPKGPRRLVGKTDPRSADQDTHKAADNVSSQSATFGEIREEPSVYDDMDTSNISQD